MYFLLYLIVSSSVRYSTDQVVNIVQKKIIVHKNIFCYMDNAYRGNIQFQFRKVL